MAAAAASGASKKRKGIFGLPFDDEQPLPPSSLDGVTTSSVEGDRRLHAVQSSLERLLTEALAGWKAAENEAKRLAEEMHAMISEKGGPREPQQTSGTLTLNVGGTVFPVSRAALMRPSMVRNYLSVLLLRFEAALPHDAEKRPYLESCPAYFRWLLNELTFVERGREDAIELTAALQNDPSYAEYHALFMREFGSGDGDSSGSGDVQMGEGEGQRQTDVAGPFAAFDESRRLYERAYEALKAEKERTAAFLCAMEPFMKTDDSEEDEVLSVTILGERVSVMRRTLSPLGPTNSPLLNRFSPTYQLEPDVRQTSAEHLQRVVDFARRQAVMPAGQKVAPPVIERRRELFVEDLQMYGLKHQPFYRWGAGGDLIVTSEDHLASLVELTGRMSKPPSLLYKSSRDGFGHSSLLDCVSDVSNLLFVVQHNDTHKFAAFVDGPLEPPADPTSYETTDCPVRVYSISGACDGPTRIDTPPDGRQAVAVAGREGAVRWLGGRPFAKVAIYVDDAAGVVLAYAEPGLAADLSSCGMMVKNPYLPAGYRGPVDAAGDGTLAGSMTFTITEMEVWTLS
ncbi:unnamed protein product [Vitrella brassicaformis CCMP3155]|uniref:TLDc domain-containing protein n=1 Tax=Vitrella brassicaformis (strain CCMP3155) TaxID=1169540 RepID=A0A0G4FVA1_VITBC|nr:unnamed protein product [Vitrella brassicaformis CCMP3155]|eukprot:CEM18862.1 unnamed protein product [Vitrella brassicaformis CCMP3155]